MPTSKPTFLVCVNDKPHSKTALRFACTRAKRINSEVLLMYVVDPVDYNSLFSVGDVIKEERVQHAEDILETMVEDAKKWAKITPRTKVCEGLIKDEVIKLIQEDSSISLLVLGVAADGSSNKTGLLTQLAGEIGDEFNIPMLIVPGNLTDAQIKELNE